MIVYTFTYQGRMPGLNDYVKANRGKSGIFFGNQTKKFLTEDVATQIKKNLYPRFHVPVYIRFHWVETNAKRDPDNFIFAKKFILDGMVKVGMIQNDGMKNILGFEDIWEVKPETKGGVIVTVMEEKNV